MSKSIDKKRIASLSVFLIGVLAVAYYIIIAQKVEFDSDFTDTVIWAKAMITGNGVFDKSMHYAYTLPFGGSILMAPFVAIFDVSYTAHVLGFVLFFIIFVVALYKFMKAMNLTVNESLVATGLVLIMSLSSKEIRMTMWGHVIHYSLGFLFVVIGLTLFSKIDIEKISIIEKNIVETNNANRGPKYLVWVLVFGVFTLLCCTNGLTIILFYAVPLFGAIVLERFIDTESELFCKININTGIIVVVCGVLGMVGFITSKLMLRNVVTVYDDMFKTIPMWQHWVWDITERVRTFLMCFCGEVSGDVAMESFSGIRIMYMALVGFVIIFVPFIAGVSYKKIDNKNMRIFLLSYYVLLFATLFVFDFSVARGTAHRLAGLYMTAVTVTVVYMIWLARDVKLQRFGYLLAFILAGASLFCLYGTASLRGENRYSKLARVLEENELKYGYAEYWSAQVTTVLSDNRVEVASVFINEDGSIAKQEYNTFEKQFSEREDSEKYFVFLSAWEYETVKDTIGKDSSEVIQFDDDGYIMVFDNNIF